MANYWYVRSVSGTASTATTRATTDITVQRTGAFTAMAAGDHFPDITTCMLGDDTGTPVAGDFIFVADDHSLSSAAQVTLSPAAETSTPVIIVSVDQTACDVYSGGASEAATGGTTDVGLSTTAGTKAHIIGVDLSTDDDIDATTSNGSLTIENSTITLTGSADAVKVAQDGAFLAIRNSTLVWTAGSTTGCFLTIQSGVRVELENCVFGVGSGSLDDLVRGSGTAGGYTFRVDNCDLSLVAGYMCGFFGSNNIDDHNIDFRMSNCRMHANKLFVEEHFQSAGQYFLATNCSDVAAEAEYQFFQRTMAGDVEDTGDDGISGGIYRVESTAFSGGNKVSFKCTTHADCSEGTPLTFDMPARFADLTAAGEDQLTVYIASASTLTQANTWIEVSYPDATNKQLWKTTSSRLADILGATALTADGGSSDWENAGVDLTTENEYKITVTTVTGGECVPHVRFFCTVPSITFYVDTTIDLS